MVDLHLFKKNSLVKFRQNQQHKSKSKIKSKNGKNGDCTKDERSRCHC